MIPRHRHRHRQGVAWPTRKRDRLCPQRLQPGKLPDKHPRRRQHRNTQVSTARVVVYPGNRPAISPRPAPAPSPKRPAPHQLRGILLDRKLHGAHLHAAILEPRVSTGQRETLHTRPTQGQQHERPVVLDRRQTRHGRPPLVPLRNLHKLDKRPRRRRRPV